MKAIEKPNRNIRYSEAFKRQVVDQVASGHFGSAYEASQAYRIKGATTVTSWLRKYGNEELIPKKTVIMNAKEIDENKTLKKRVRELESALSETQMRNLLNECHLEIACEHLDTDLETFKKKHATLLSRRRQSGGGK